MKEAFVCEGIRTPIGRFGGLLSSIRTDDLAALPLKKLKEDLKDVDWESIDEVFFGNANQAGEDNRIVYDENTSDAYSETMEEGDKEDHEGDDDHEGHDHEGDKEDHE